ncbi:MAG: glycoside hydrolase family 3 C-terminal domain-containing protein, partial [Duncaniella sp.]|nr:glycoside hydrolase family 3 C-terminal domain-containing protein [Duncaniella sp.]
PGQAGGTAVADVLFGDYNPAGRLPVTFYRDDSQLPDFEDYSMIGRTYRYMTDKPLYPFGYGLSYTTFDYKGAKLGKKKIKAGESVDLTVDVKNIGDRDGDEVVQVYMRPLDRKDAPVKTLCDFKRVNIKKGDTARVKFSLSPSAFETFDHESGRMKVLPGRYELLYGPSSSDLTPVEVVVK